MKEILTTFLLNLFNKIKLRIKEHPFLFGALVEVFVALIIILHYIFIAFNRLGEYAIPIVAVPGIALAMGLLCFFADYSTAEGKEKYQRRLEKLKDWFNKDSTEKGILILVSLGIIDSFLFAFMIVIISQ